MSAKSLTKIKNYIGNQYKDIPTFEDESDEVKNGRIDELQCLETYLDYLIALESNTLDENYDKMFSEETKA